MGISNLKSQAGGGTDWSKFTPLYRKYSSTSYIVGNYYSAISITGSGFISHLISYQPLTSSMGYMRVTLDGVVVYHGRQQNYNGSKNDVCGLVNPALMNYTGSTFGPLDAGFVPGSLSAVKPYPVTDQSESTCLINTPIFFKSSLLVEVMTGSGGGTLNAFLLGGLG